MYSLVLSSRQYSRRNASKLILNNIATESNEAFWALGSYMSNQQLGRMEEKECGINPTKIKGMYTLGFGANASENGGWDDMDSGR